MSRRVSRKMATQSAIAQTNLKRMLAYSTISHVGFLLLGILAGTANGYASSMFYVLVYAVMSVGSFGIIILLSRAGFEADRLEDFKGLSERSPWYALKEHMERSECDDPRVAVGAGGFVGVRTRVRV